MMAVFQSSPSMNRYEFAVVVILRVSAALVLCSIPTIFLPEEWMVKIHRWLGIGDLPRAPIVWYMARSLSAMYAILGCFTWAISIDTRRYGPLILLWSIMHLAMGALMVLVDYSAGLPVYWIIGEGPPLIVLGALVWWLQTVSEKVEWTSDR